MRMWSSEDPEATYYDQLASDADIVKVGPASLLLPLLLLLLTLLLLLRRRQRGGLHACRLCRAASRPLGARVTAAAAAAASCSPRCLTYHRRWSCC